MLKGFVSGEEKDIKRIPMKGQNLFPQGSLTGKTTVVKDTFNEIAGSIVFGNGQYTLSMDTTTGSNAGIFKVCFTYTDDSQDKSAWITANRPTIMLVSDGAKVVKSISITDYNMYVDVTLSNIMLNLGSTPLPYEPYGYQEGWEVRDNEDRLIWGREDELQTATGTLPFKGYSLPLKTKSLLGNAVQNGTPAPSPVNPNLVDPSATVPGYQESNGSIHEPSSGNERTTDWIPFTTDALYAIVSGSNSGNINWVLYDSSKQPLYFYGPTFSPNTVIIISRSGYSTAAFIRISWTNAANQPICVTTERRSEYIAFDPNPPGPVVPEMCGVRTGNLFDKTATDTNNGYMDSKYIGYDGSIGNSANHNISEYIAIPVGTEHLTISNISASTNVYCQFYDSSKNAISIFRYDTIPCTVSIPSNAKYIRCSISKVQMSNFMLNLGSTALPYEPYGWKVPFENRGENLFDVTSVTHEALDTSGAKRYESAMDLSGFIEVDGDYTVSWKVVRSGAYMRVSTFDENKNFIARITELNTFKRTQYSNSHTGYIRINYENSYGLSDIMLTPGSSPKPYSPYLNETLPVYLGEIPTVRRVKKLVLDGTEEWQTYAQAPNTYRVSINDAQSIGNPALCSHFENTPISTISSGKFTVGSTWIYIRYADVTDVTDFKAYLASEYAAGHPVTIWYVLANEETTISNEPLCKISTYADELTAIQVHGLSAPLYGIGDYKDALNLSTGVVTRKVKKLVLTGEENVEIKSGNAKWYIPIADMKTPANFAVIDWYCSHYQAVSNSATWTSYDYMISWSTADSGLSIGLRIRDVDFSTGKTLADFKSYLAAQYQAGTPVTIWYVLSTPETETVTVPTGMTGEIEGYLTQVSTPTPTNRSVPKWNGVEETGGTYAVTVYTPPEIPTTTGQNTLTVETEKIHGLTNPLCGIGDYKDVLNLSTGVITRKVKKLVLDGTEEWIYRSGEPQNVYFIELAGVHVVNNAGLCTHYPNQDSGSFNAFEDKHFMDRVSTDETKSYLAIRDSSFVYLADFKAYLAAQYAAGHPVTVWYVLNTPETETITVPYGLECSVEGYLTQSVTPTPSSPITPDSNGILESGGTYAVEVSLAPSSLTVKGHIKELT